MIREIKIQIRETLNSFATGDLYDQAIGLFETLGYHPERKNRLEEPTFHCFMESFPDSDRPFRADKAMADEWQFVDILFQLTGSEIKKLLHHNETQTVIDFGTEGVVGINKAIIESYLFFAIGLARPRYSRTELSAITREVNRLFPMPVLILFSHGDTLTLSIINRRIHKKDTTRDVLEKVTLIKDIRIHNPHRAHLDILSELAFGEIKRKYKCNSFVELQSAFGKILDIQSLNNRFYKDLQSWFYMALKEIKLSGPNLPDYIKEEELKKNFLVRLLARLMFCWFLKEKGLIKPELLELFSLDNKKYPLLKDFNSLDFLNTNGYYRGILQNIFFNCLNVNNKSSIKDLKWTQYLHPDLDLKWFFDIPYLNGGIFDILPEDCSNDSIGDDVLKIPNFLFYGENRTQENLPGLNIIFKSYKFTIEENTPVEEDIALDPEMLGLVFESLLAELDPNLEENARKSIRKMTGSYYTPRKVIQEMVNESLYLFLRNKLKNSTEFSEETNNLLQDLVFENHYSSEYEYFTISIVDALDKLRAIDPACGSGAFPMGMLHRMVEILKLVDPDNSRWIELKIKSVDHRYREEFKKILTLHLDDYSRKLGIIRDSIYGIDIQPLAVQITKLRFFISLLADQKTGDNQLTPMPNMETKILCADTLKNIRPNLFSGAAIDQLERVRNQYYQPEISHETKELLADEIAGILDEAFPMFSKQVTGQFRHGQNPKLLKEWFMHATIPAPFFNMDFFYPEVGREGGFDIVMGNPPYGGFKIDDEVRAALSLESKDPYGAFIARFLCEAGAASPLKHGGVLAYIVSDTFMTIKSHFPLRRQMMQNYIHKMIRVHPDTFRATVNTAIIICERNLYPKGEDGKPVPAFNEKHVCQMVDMTNISIHDDFDRFVDILHQTEGFRERKQFSNTEYAIYYYPQTLIANNSNLPFFVASPKLFSLMKDQGDDLIRLPVQCVEKIVHKRILSFNDSTLNLYKLGDVGAAPHGISTGDNKKYVRIKSTKKGQYQQIEDYMICSEEDLKHISEEEKIYGFNKDWTKLSGCFVPFEKGGESDSDDGWLPNYYVPTIYYINWASGAIMDMKKNAGFRWFNTDYFFKKGLTFSISGIYAPTFRFNSGGIFEAKGSGLFCDILDNETLLGIMASKMSKYILKSFIKHSVDTSGDDIASFILLDSAKKELSRIKELVEKLVIQQKDNPRYDYASREQIEIDRLVYEAYGLNAEDVEEVENWYARRYPKLSAAQKQNLRKLGKSDDYLVLYGLRGCNS